MRCTRFVLILLAVMLLAYATAAILYDPGPPAEAPLSRTVVPSPTTTPPPTTAPEPPPTFGPPVTPAPPTTRPSTTTTPTTRSRSTSTIPARAAQPRSEPADLCARAIAANRAPLAPGATERCSGNPVRSWGASNGAVAWYTASRWPSAGAGTYTVAHERGHLEAYAAGRADWPSEARADRFAARYYPAETARWSPYR